MRSPSSCKIFSLYYFPHREKKDITAFQNFLYHFSKIYVSTCCLNILLYRFRTAEFWGKRKMTSSHSIGPKRQRWTHTQEHFLRKIQRDSLVWAGHGWLSLPGREWQPTIVQTLEHGCKNLPARPNQSPTLQVDSQTLTSLSQQERKSRFTDTLASNPTDTLSSFSQESDS